MMSCIHYITQNSTAAKLGSHTGRAGFYCSNRWREKGWQHASEQKGGEKKRKKKGGGGGAERDRKRQRRQIKKDSVKKEGLTKTQTLLLRVFSFDL